MAALATSLAISHRLDPAPALRPQSILAAGRASFDVLAPPDMTATAIRYALFHELPMAANGWDFDETGLRRLHNCRTGTIWRVERF